MVNVTGINLLHANIASLVLLKFTQSPNDVENLYKEDRENIS